MDTLTEGKLNDGQTQKAWPLIGSLTRTVDYLQLTVEPSASRFGALMNPLKLVQPTDGWTELEERRRLFWVIFLLDRYATNIPVLIGVIRLIFTKVLFSIYRLEYESYCRRCS
jgi:hypothetical protein